MQKALMYCKGLEGKRQILSGVLCVLSAWRDLEFRVILYIFPEVMEMLYGKVKLV
jgi:hypothetical protein